MEIRFVRAPSALGNAAEVTDHRLDELPALLTRVDGIVWVDIPIWDDDAKRGADGRVLLPPAGDPGLHGTQSGAQGARVSGSSCSWCCTRRSPARRGMCTTSSSTSSSARTIWSRCTVRSTRRSTRRWRRSRCSRCCTGWNPAGCARQRRSRCRTAMVSALTGRLRNYTAVLTQDVWQLEQRVTAGHLGDRGEVPGGDVPGPARAADGADHGRAEPRGLRPDGEDRGVRTRAGRVIGRGHRRPVRPAAGDGARPEGLPVRARSSSTRPGPTPR